MTTDRETGRRFEIREAEAWGWCRGCRGRGKAAGAACPGCGGRGSRSDWRVDLMWPESRWIGKGRQVSAPRDLLHVYDVVAASSDPGTLADAFADCRRFYADERAAGIGHRSLVPFEGREAWR